MERLDKKTFIQQMNSKSFLVGFFNFTQFAQLREGYIVNSVVSLYEEVYEIDDCFLDKDFLVLIRKSEIVGKGFEPVRLVEKPQGFYEKSDNDFKEVKAAITYLDIEPEFYYVRES